MPMTFQQQTGEVVLRPGQSGLTLTVIHDQPLTFSTKRAWPTGIHRWSTSLLVAIGALLLPLSSSAANFSSNEIVTQTNTIRQQHGLPALTVNAKLEKAALLKAQDMFTRQYFDHLTPDGQVPWQWFVDSGYQFTSAGENLAIDFVNGKDIVPAWMNSASHKKNILNTAFHDIGMAVLDGTMNGATTTVVVQFFGSQTSSTAPAVVETTPSPAPTVAAASVLPPLPVEPSAPVVTEPVAPVELPETLPSVEATTVDPVPTLLTADGTRFTPLTSATIQPVGLAVSPYIAPILFATLGCYVALLAGVAVIESLTSGPRQSRHLVSFLGAYQ